MTARRCESITGSGCTLEAILLAPSPDAAIENIYPARLRFELAAPGSPEAEQATADIKRLREEIPSDA